MEGEREKDGAERKEKEREKRASRLDVEGSFLDEGTLRQEKGKSPLPKKGEGRGGQNF